MVANSYSFCRPLLDKSRFLYLRSMRDYPVLHLDAFHGRVTNDEFYANLFSDHLENHHTAISVPHKHDFYLVVLFTQGSGRHEVDFTEYSISPGSLFYMKPGQTHHWEFSSPPEGYIFFHSRAFFEIPEPVVRLHQYPMYALMQTPAHLQLDEEHRLPEITGYFRAMYEEYGQQQPFKRNRLRNLIDQLYIELSRILYAKYPGEPGRGVQPFSRLQQLESLIDQHYAGHKTASDYADMLHISPKYLNKLVQHALGKTTTDLIHDRLLLEAKRLLVRKERPVQDVAEELGFEDAAYFSRLFRKKTGVSPKAFSERY